MRLPRRLLVRKRLLRHLLILLVSYLPVLPARRRRPSHTIRNVACSARAVSSRFAAVAYSSTRRVDPLLPLLHLVPWVSLRWLSLSLCSPFRHRRFPLSRHLLPSR